MPRTKVSSIAVEVYAAGSIIEVELRVPGPNGIPRVHLIPVRHADRRAAREVVAELELGLVDAIHDGLRAARP